MCETSTVDLTRLIGSVNLYTWTRHTEPIVRSGVRSLAQVYNFDLSHNDIQPILFDVNVLYNVPKMVFFQYMWIFIAHLSKRLYLEHFGRFRSHIVSTVTSRRNFRQSPKVAGNFSRDVAIEPALSNGQSLNIILKNDETCVLYPGNISPIFSLPNVFVWKYYS